MPSLTVPFVGSYNQRAPREDGKITTDISTKDRRFRGVILRPESFNGEGLIHVEKRPGITTGTTVNSGGDVLFLAKASLNQNTIDDCFITSVINGTGQKVYIGTTLVGTIDSGDFAGWVAQIGLSGSIYFMISPSSGNTGAYFISNNEMAGNTTFTADSTSGSITLSSVSSFTGLTVGQLLSGTGIATGARIASLNSGGGTLTMTIAATANGTGTTITRERLCKIIDADFPTGTIGPFVELNGTIYIAQRTTGRVYGSDLNSVSSWSASNYVTANIEADELVGLARYKNQIAAFGRKSIEWYYDAGNASGSPLSRSEQLFTRIGAQQSVNAISSIDDTLFWYGSDGGCWTLNGFTPVKISDQFIDSILFGQGNYGSKIVDAFYLKGKPYVQFLYTTSNAPYNISGSNYAFWYDINAGIWIEPNISFPCRFESKFLAVSPIVYSPSTTSAGKYFSFNDSATGFTDNGSAFSAIAQSARNNFGTNKRKTITRVSLVGDTQSSGTATLEYSDDDYQNWTTAGTFDMTKTNPSIYRVGSFVGGRAWRITHSANTPFRANALEIDYTVGKH